MPDPTAHLAAVAVDALKGTVVEKVLSPAVQSIWDLVRSILFPWWEPALREVRLRLPEAIEALRRKDGALVDALARSLKRGEADALATAMLRAAAQATTEERMKMLAAAAGGVFTPDLDSEMRSRVSRAVAQLEPSDVVELRRLDEAERSPGIHFSPMMTPEREPLVVTGCLADRTGRVGGSLQVTALGRAVLTSLARWEPGHGAA